MKANIYFGSTCKDLMFSPTIVPDVTEQMNIVCEEEYTQIKSVVIC